MRSAANVTHGATAPEGPIAAAFDRLNAERVEWVLLRGDDLRTEGDVDLLIAKADRRRLATILGACGFVHVPAAGHASHRFFLAYERRRDRWVKLDVVSELSYGRDFALRSRAEAECLARRGTGDVNVLDGSDELWALLLHCLLDKRAFAEKHRRRLGELAPGATVDSPLARAVDRAAPRGSSSARLLALAREGAWEQLLVAGGDLRAAWWREQRFGARLRSLRNRSARGLSRLLDPVRRRGFAVVLLAPDGAGKTTLAQSLSETFAIPVSVVYMGLYRRSGGPDRRYRVPGVFVLERLLLSWGRAGVGFAARAAGRLVVFDRYPYEALLTPPQDMNRLGRGHRTVLGHSCPHPDLTILLDAPGAVLHARKPERPADDLERVRRRLADLRRRVPRAVVVDATPAFDDVRRNVTDMIWRAYRGAAPAATGDER
jgi:thymidylate kinase